ncbi:CD99 antigen isoform X3 [Strigops habroptila]|uniref:CD99 antigen isoform X3 n=1 Tax=Strigops habroptila TaxID=2489341 RepID=UPI0011D01E27|nr:CD99 antigen isoform X3 [Strigops habroptila]
MQRWRLLPVVVVVLTVLVTAQDDFDLEHALQPDDPKPTQPANPKDTDNSERGPPILPKDSDFKDSDLYDGSLPKGGGGDSGGNERKGPSPNNGEEAEDEENVNMESHRGAQSEPPVQRTLLEN